MAEIPTLDPSEYPSDETFDGILERLRSVGLVRTEGVGPEVPISPTPEGYFALGVLLHLILATSGSKDALERMRARDLAGALTAIGVREIAARPDDGQHG